MILKKIFFGHFTSLSGTGLFLLSSIFPCFWKMKDADHYAEQELVILLRNIPPVAFQQLFDLYSYKLYYFAFSYLKSNTESEELVLLFQQPVSV